MLLKDIKCFLLDLDGTVHLSGVAIDGAVDAIERLRARARILFLTNNSSLSRLDYVKKISKMGISVTAEDIYTSGNATIDYLKRSFPSKKVFLFGTETLKKEFQDFSIVLENDNPDLVVIGFNTEMTYDDLARVCNFIRDGVPYILTHSDINCPTSTGYIPDVGSLCALIEKSCNGIKPIEICGKPFTPIGDGILKMINCKNHEVAMVGDRLATDITFALNNSFTPVLVLTGEAKAGDLKNFEGKEKVVVVESIAKLS